MIKKALTIGNLNSVFMYEFASEILLKVPGLQVDVLSEILKTTSAGTYAEALKEQGCTLYFFYDAQLREKSGAFSGACRGVKRIWAHRMSQNYDLVHINSVSVFSFIAAWHAKKDARVVVSYWGSDLLRASNLALLTMRPLLKRADVITVETDFVRKRLSELFAGRFDDKVMLATFGTKNAEIMHAFVQSHTREECKKKFGLPADKLCIFCGYNGSRSHRHVEITNLLETLPQEAKDRLCLVFHCGYSLSEDYRSELEALTQDSLLECRLISDFLTGEELAALRMCADVMLNLQPTDSISTSMLETLEAGAIVVKGDWLVYPELEKRGAYLLSIPSMEALPSIICDIAENLDGYREKTRQNRGIVLMQSWNTVREGWLEALGEE